jgi:hypothetical protein
LDTWWFRLFRVEKIWPQYLQVQVSVPGKWMFSTCFLVTTKPDQTNMADYYISCKAEDQKNLLIGMYLKKRKQCLAINFVNFKQTVCERERERGGEEEEAFTRYLYVISIWANLSPNFLLLLLLLLYKHGISVFSHQRSYFRYKKQSSVTKTHDLGTNDI